MRNVNQKVQERSNGKVRHPPERDSSQSLPRAQGKIPRVARNDMARNGTAWGSEWHGERARNDTKRTAEILREVYPETLHIVQGRSREEGERAQDDMRQARNDMAWGSEWHGSRTFFSAERGPQTRRSLLPAVLLSPQQGSTPTPQTEHKTKAKNQDTSHGTGSVPWAFGYAASPRSIAAY